MENKANETIDIRAIVLQMLVDTIEKRAFSHIVLNQAFSSYTLSHQDMVFLGRLYHGTLERLIYLDWIISSYSSVKLNKMKPVIRNILRMSIYQMLFMDAVPDRAAVSEAVRLTKKKGLKGLAPFVNGLLRAFQRGGIKPGMPENVKHSAPLWLYELEVKELGKKRADAFFDASSDAEPKLYVRMNLNAASKEEIIQMLEKDGACVEEVSDVKEALKLSHVGELTELSAFKKGFVSVQDLSSMYVGKMAAEFSNADSVRQILDVCAAPGGKSLHLAERFPDAYVSARDLSEAKVKLIEENIKRSGLKNIQAEVFDALVLDEPRKEKMDIVLADLPCSGLGVIGRKADIKLRVTEEDLHELSKLQRQILEVVSQYVKPGGILIYSTCTVNQKENQENAAWFLEEYPFEKLYERQFIPGEDECDGFYLTVFRKADQKQSGKE